MGMSGRPGGGCPLQLLVSLPSRGVVNCTAFVDITRSIPRPRLRVNLCCASFLLGPDYSSHPCVRLCFHVCLCGFLHAFLHASARPRSSNMFLFELAVLGTRGSCGITVWEKTRSSSPSASAPGPSKICEWLAGIIPGASRILRASMLQTSLMRVRRAVCEC